MKRVHIVGIAHPFFWGAHPLQGLGEAWLIGLLTLFGLSRLAGQVTSSALGNGTLLLCGTSGIWAVLRIRIPQIPLWRQLLTEVSTGAACSLAMTVGLSFAAGLTGLDPVWQQSSLGIVGTTLLLALIGPGYLAARVGVRIWFAWNRLRRRRMLWSLTHAHLAVVLVTVLVVLILGLLGAVASSGSAARQKVGEPPTLLASELLLTVFPAFSLIVVFALIVLVLVLPASALFSFLVARTTTRRLEALASVAAAWRRGDYAARVDVTGQDEVAQLQSDFNSMAKELQRTLSDLRSQRDTVTQVLQSRRELVASVSHELRTPVATLRSYLESSQAGSAGRSAETLDHDLQIMEGEVIRLQRLIDDLFALSRAEAGRLALDLQSTDVGALAQRRVETVAPLAWQSDRVEVTAQIPPGLPHAVVDAGRLDQVLTNLLRNAVLHTLPGGIVAVVLAAEDRCLRIEVRDTGQGIDPSDLPHIWERFYRGKQPEDAPPSGSGLGLALVKELTEAMGGSVKAESTVGEGSCFTLRLPTG